MQNVNKLTLVHKTIAIKNLPEVAKMHNRTHCRIELDMSGMNRKAYIEYI